ncbi:MAG: Ribose import ATP-binding protein [Deinococcota bacterium]|jgi:ABC-type sugar transport system ATPase subunit
MLALEARNIRKTYGGVVALESADLEIQAGAVHGLLGGNGAGKSTLVKIITGAVKSDGGELKLEGVITQFSSTADAARRGVAVVSQELSLFPDLDILGNLFPMREPLRVGLVNKKQMLEAAIPILSQLGLTCSPFELLGNLSLAERQLVEIARALLANPKVLVLDEPTSALEAASAGRLLQTLRVLRQRQVAVVFVSHILQEVMELCDEVTVLRDGKVALQSAPIASLDVPRIVAAMLGERSTLPHKTKTSQRQEASLVLEQVSVDNSPAQSLTAYAGEVLGLTGIAGAGHLLALEVAAGLSQASRGQVRLPNQKAAPKDLRQAITFGVAYVSGDRKRVGLMLDKPIWENIAQVRSIGMLRDGWLLRAATLKARATQYIAKLGLKAASLDDPANSLSGGNQQKVVLAKWLETAPKVLLLDDPTRGVDVGAKAEMHTILRGLAKDGAVVMLASTDLEELTEVCDRVLVYFRGQICAELSGSNLSTQTLLEVMNTGQAP